MIKKFDGWFYFLSNFADAKVSYKGHIYLNSESAFQAQKCPERERESEDLLPSQAKRLGRAVARLCFLPLPLLLHG